MAIIGVRSSCKGLCENFSLLYTRYAGYSIKKYCCHCSVYINLLQFPQFAPDGSRCPCCRFKLRSKQRSRYRQVKNRKIPATVFVLERPATVAS